MEEKGMYDYVITFFCSLFVNLLKHRTGKCQTVEQAYVNILLLNQTSGGTIQVRDLENNPDK